MKIINKIWVAHLFLLYTNLQKKIFFKFLINQSYKIQKNNIKTNAPHIMKRFIT